MDTPTMLDLGRVPGSDRAPRPVLTWLFGLWWGLALGAGPWPGNLGSAVAAPVAFETLLTEQTSGLRQSYQAAIDSEAAWRSFWSRVYANREPAPALRPVDFRRDRVIAVAIGEQPTGGYGVSIERIEETGGRLDVHYRRTCPASGSFNILLLTQPVQAVRLARSALRPVFLETADGHCPHAGP